MSGTCYRCFKSKEACLCEYIKELDTGVKFIILIHPHEARLMRTGTGRLAHLSLKDSELIQGVNFTENERLNTLLSDPTYYPLLLYPGENAITAQSDNFKNKLEGRIPMVIILDGTWSEAKKMLKYSINLQSLPRLSFNRGYRSRFIFKKEPTPDAISTIEACYYLIKELEEIGMANGDEAYNMMALFDRMVNFQLECERKRRLLNAPERVPLSSIQEAE
ncbi:MAG: DTW domain-containing protein [Sphaerochaetaceae bacterium]|nr:DTW domain-containing protein [Sphaerochaetaceae bacterium]